MGPIGCPVFDENCSAYLSSNAHHGIRGCA